MNPSKTSNNSQAGSAVVLTPAQYRRLQQAISQVDAGNFSAEWPLVPRGRERASLEKTCGALCAMGLLRPYVHGGWEVTAEGRELVTG